MSLLAVFTLVGVLFWTCMSVLLWRVVRSVPEVQGLSAPPPQRWPRVSLVMPARNEEATLADALRSKLADTYPDLELVLVNDRSTDATRTVAEAFARTEPRLRVVHLEQLPEGWLGKVHAMQRGLELATGEWVLFSDADVHLAPGTLERIVARAEEAGWDHVTVLPTITTRRPVLQLALSTFFRLVCVLGRPWAVANPRSSAAAGVGAFNLVRRSALDRTPGLEWLRMEIGDDLALGMMLKRAGARQAVLNGRGVVSLEFYPSYRAMVRALEKNGAAAPFPALLLVCVLLVGLEWAPLAGLLSGSPPLVALALGTWALGGAASARFFHWLGLARWPALLPPVGVLPLMGAMLRSGALALWRGGVLWRGTFYPTRAVRAGMRLRPGGGAP